MKQLFRSIQKNFITTVGMLVLATMSSSYAQAAECDRDCLGDMMTLYLDAMVANNASRLPLTSEVRFTEDSQELTLGQGLWETVTEKGDFRQDYLDVRKQIALTHVQVFEEDIQVLYSVQLYIEDQQISGIETLVQRIMPDSRFQPTMLGKPLVGMNEPLTASQQLSREEMIDLALTYTEGLRVGTFIDVTPFAEEAYRIENGSFMAGVGCPREECPDIQTQNIITHPDIVASVAAVDEEMGNVVLWMNFGDTDSYGENNALVIFESFNVWGGEIHAVNAFFRILPKETQRGWPTSR